MKGSPAIRSYSGTETHASFLSSSVSGLWRAESFTRGQENDLKMLPGAGVDGFRREGQTEEDCQYTRCESCCKVEAIGMMNSCHNVE